MMPNRCNNYLVVETTADHRDYFVRDRKTDEWRFKLNKIVPLYDQDDKPLNKDADENYDRYSANIENRGTKWEVDSFNVSIVSLDWFSHWKKKWVAVFDSARSPPIPVIYKMLENLKRDDPESTLIFDYSEPGMGFFGRIENGIDNYYNYNDVAMEWCDEIGMRIVDMEHPKTKIFIEITGEEEVIDYRKVRKEHSKSNFSEDEIADIDEIIKDVKNFAKR